MTAARRIAQLGKELEAPLSVVVNVDVAMFDVKVEGLIYFQREAIELDRYPASSPSALHRHVRRTHNLLLEFFVCSRSHHGHWRSLQIELRL